MTLRGRAALDDYSNILGYKRTITCDDILGMPLSFLTQDFSPIYTPYSHLVVPPGTHDHQALLRAAAGVRGRPRRGPTRPYGPYERRGRALYELWTKVQYGVTQPGGPTLSDPRCMMSWITIYQTNLLPLHLLHHLCLARSLGELSMVNLQNETAEVGSEGSSNPQVNH
ncbi:uncharacterized protein EI90DRAFT_2613438 [Cantharellus anzutake]|uniref:uncharacterized protein n=1 Tax=Cantharellus anzutake TaxID=1750568 RepID=UPI0019056707|nr:uncharacterized protein EI90DRAFT_2613438 [Cantharellus anzutake]KAF8319893.1 hypothetical protein EI90DRAFT_2613438 [Cantharellus anzutake]